MPPVTHPQRSLAIRTGAAALVPPHDVVLSKLAVGREMDLEFARAAATLGLVERSMLLARLALVSAPAQHSRLIGERIEGLFG
jgi:hypothetical protein